jgi:hypothetical protein
VGCVGVGWVGVGCVGVGVGCWELPPGVWMSGNKPPPEKRRLAAAAGGRESGVRLWALNPAAAGGWRGAMRGGRPAGAGLRGGVHSP